MSSELTPDKIAKSFIKVYYQTLAKNPWDLCKFYNNDSSFTHCEGHQTAEAVIGAEAIKRRIEGLNLAGAVLDLTEGYVDAQPAASNGVLITVFGNITFRGEPARPFLQAFVLASQSDATSFYVRNSLLRLLDVPSSASVAENSIPASTLTSTITHSAPVSAPIAAPVIEVPTPEAAEVDEQHEANIASVVDEVQEMTLEDTPEEVSEPMMEEPVPVPPVEEEPVSFTGTFAQLVKRWGDKSSGADTAAASAAPTSTAPAPTSANAAAKPRANKKPDAKNAGASLYVSQLPFEANEGELRKLFAVFGKIRNVDVNAIKGFAYIDYVNADSVQVALVQASTDPSVFELRGCQLKIEQRVHTRSVQNKDSKGTAGTNKTFNKRPDQKQKKTGDRPAAAPGTAPAKKSPRAPREGKAPAGGAAKKVCGCSAGLHS